MKRNSIVIHGQAGERARSRGILYVLWPLLSVLFAFGVMVGLALPKIPWSWVSIGFLILTILSIFFTWRGLLNLQAFFKGAHGEDYVAFLLSSLPGGWHVFHDLSGSPGGIDHVVVGDRGIFAIETKCWSGKVVLERDHLTVNGVRPKRAPMIQAQVSAAAIERRILEQTGEDITCQPVVCFASGTLEPDILTCGPVTVCNASRLTEFLLSRKSHLSDLEIDRIAKTLQKDEL